MSIPHRRRPPSLVESLLVVARSWTGAAMIAVLAVAGIGSCRTEMPPLADDTPPSPGHHRASPRDTTTPE